MDITKVKSALANVRTELKNVIDAEIKARSFGSLKGLATIDTWIGEAEAKLDTVATPKKKRERKEKKSKAA